MPNVTEVSHAQLLMWVGTFFFAGMGVYASVFFFMFRGFRAKVKKIGDDVVEARNKLDDIDQRKVELIVYMDDKEEAKKVIASLQTTDRCMLMQRVCVGSITPTLATIKDNLDAVLRNQEELMGVKQVLNLVTNRQKEVIERIDTHLNSHAHGITKQQPL
jgi:hypothetical protein